MSVVESYRLERDPLGEVCVPKTAYYGPQTARALQNFSISGIPISHFPQLIRALGMVKKACARANMTLGNLPAEKAGWIEAACDDVVAGRLDAEFPLDVFQGGAGTSTNMNVNEVIANRALDLQGLPLGQYSDIHPNNDVNLAQSTNDVYPTAIRLAILFSYVDLSDELTKLADALDEKATEFRDVLKLGRTQLQDAVPMTLGQEFAAFAATLREDVERLSELSLFLKEINLGGTAIGTGINTDRRYAEIAITELSAISGLSLKSASNLVEACWDTGAFVLFSGMLKRTATKLSKICSDLRLLSSGPRGGLNEINLPPLQPGSSIMPGKVNPVIPEVVNQVAFQIIGADLTITMAAEAGQLQLNVMEPVITYNILQSLSLLKNAVVALRSKCVTGISANVDQCRAHLESSTAVATALTPIIGYERAADLAKLVLLSGSTIREVMASQADITEDLVRVAADPAALTAPSARHS
ncbi:Aspartate ammonia-lyase (plasmid) [Rhizobium freirei PRF 81]|uniref:Aspartate ammonia-lyase n=1 Tax=Rhizobium freirei PRF 81 TaxID=363754 RepID=N6U0C0_9HYPH|nr:aspartate ammonia-lyase [Rhizobium freirei]ENN83853.1 Aspartate ammonia-lyase [Rhizobium freirei PRF 81]